MFLRNVVTHLLDYTVSYTEDYILIPYGRENLKSQLMFVCTK
jgi:hypothetical protein